MSVSVISNKVAHLNKINKILREIKNLSSGGCCFERLVIFNINIVRYTDPIYTDLPDESSQGRAIVLLADKEMTSS